MSDIRANVKSLTSRELVIYTTLMNIIISYTPFFVTSSGLKLYGAKQKDIDVIFKHGKCEYIYFLKEFFLYYSIIHYYSISENYEDGENLFNRVLKDLEGNEYYLDIFYNINSCFKELENKICKSKQDFVFLANTIINELLIHNPVNVSRETLEEWFGEDDELCAWFKKEFYDVSLLPYPNVINRLRIQGKNNDIIRIFAKINEKLTDIKSKRQWSLFEELKVGLGIYEIENIETLYTDARFEALIEKLQ